MGPRDPRAGKVSLTLRCITSVLRFGSLIVALGRRVNSPAPTVIYIIAGEMDSPGLERQT